MNINKLLWVAVAGLVPAIAVFANQTPGVSPGAGNRYATDAYPGFDSEKEIVSPERKSPRWFSFWFGPKFDNVSEQFAYCNRLLSEGNPSKAKSELDALVREWPTAPLAAQAQKLLAEVCYEQLHDAEDAFAEYRYLLDFYSSSCEYDRVADRLYEVAGQLKEEGKEVMFVRFANTVDVRRAYEACVLHAPGAKWVPEAMLTIARLRTDEEKFAEAVKVYENLRNLYAESPAAKVAILEESRVRMMLLEDYGYNRLRCRDTMDFLKLAQGQCLADDVAEIKSMREKAEQLLEFDDYQSARFYDSPTRTSRSAINAYEKYLAEHSEGAHADEVRSRLESLKGAVKTKEESK